MAPSQHDRLGISFHGIPAGGEFTYAFDVRQSGTYWYHAHSGFQEQAGLYGAIVIDPREPEPFDYDREHVVLLSDWTDRDPLNLYRLLKRQPGYFNYNDRTLGDFVRDSRRDGLKRTLDERLAWSKMRMKPSDLADVGGYGYTYLMNGAPPAGCRAHRDCRGVGLGFRRAAARARSCRRRRRVRADQGDRKAEGRGREGHHGDARRCRDRTIRRRRSARRRRVRGRAAARQGAHQSKSCKRRARSSRWPATA